MKIAIVSSSYHPYYKGGGEHSVKYLAEGLAEQGEEVIVITAYRQDQDDIVAGVRVRRVKHPNVYWSYESEHQPKYKKLLWHLIEAYNVGVSRQIKPLLLRERPDVLHIRNTEDFSPYLAKVARTLNIPVVVTLNSYTWLCPRATMFRQQKNCIQQCWDCKLITTPKKHLSKYVNTVVGVSQFVIDTHRKHQYFPAATSDVVYTSPPVRTMLPVREEKNITFGYIGRIHPTKGVHQVVQAFSSLPDDHTLLIAGEGPEDYVAYCKQLGANNPKVVFLGRYDSVQFYQQIDVVVISSLWHEPFPRVLVEAYAFGRPVIAANTGGTPEMVQPGCTGFMYDATSVADLGKAMRQATQCLPDEWRRMQEHIKVLLQDKLSNDIQRYRLIYQKLLTA